MKINERIQNDNKRIKISELEEEDIRRVVVEGMKVGKSNYESLFGAGIIESTYGSVVK